MNLRNIRLDTTKYTKALQEIKDLLKCESVKLSIINGVFVAMNLYMAFRLSLEYDQSERRLEYPLASIEMSYFKSIGLTMQAPRLCPLVSPWVILVYKLVNAVALLHVLFPVTFVRYWTIPLIIMHITMLSLICDTILCSSLEIMQIVDNPTSVCIEFIVVAWSLITVNIALVYTIILNFDQTSETLSPITQLHILTDDEVFEYFPTNIFEYSKVPCMHEFTYLIRSSSDEFDEKEHLLASMHRDLISIDRQNPCELNPFGLGQTPTQICSRIE